MELLHFLKIILRIIKSIFFLILEFNRVPEFGETNGRKTLLNEGFIYDMLSSNRRTITWRCKFAHLGCNAWVSTKLINGKLMLNQDQPHHTHDNYYLQ